MPDILAQNDLRLLAALLPGFSLEGLVVTAANRRKSFCARMSGMKRSRTSAKTANDPNSRINKSLRKWNC